MGKYFDYATTKNENTLSFNRKDIGKHSSLISLL